MSLRRILGYRWHDSMSNDLVLREADLRQVTCIVREGQLRLYGHVVRLRFRAPKLLLKAPLKTFEMLPIAEIDNISSDLHALVIISDSALGRPNTRAPN